MGSTIDKLNKLVKTKAEIRQAITDRGVEISDDTVFADYPAKINAIESNEFFYAVTNNNTNYSYLFAHHGNNRIPDISGLDTSKVTDMNSMFYESGCSKPLDLSNWDTSRVTDMSYMFCNSRYLESLNVSNWNTSKVYDMKYMFYNTAISSSMNLAHFNTSKVYDMRYMFYGCAYLESLDITGWDTSNVTRMSYMFEGCTRLRSIIGELDVSKVEGLDRPRTEGAITWYRSTFKDCESLETLYLKNIYKDISITNSQEYSIDLRDTKVKDECLLYIINELPNLYAKGLTNTSLIYLDLPRTNTLTQEQVQPALDKGWQVSNTNY